jgi:hypothetical protein
MNEKEQKPLDDDPKSEHERLQEQHGREHEADLAPSHNRPPAEQHRGGPLPNQEK